LPSGRSNKIAAHVATDIQQGEFMNKLWQKLMLSGSSMALFTAASAMGALAQGDNTDIEQVVVSASRITVAGYTQPTPVTVVGATQLNSDAYSDIMDSLRNLPQVTAPSALASSTNGSGSGGNAGEQLLNLRDLGSTRTLVLFDGQRVVASNITGGVDVSTLPSSLIQRVDVVTGGASAVWGSDAVAGVVNFVLNKNFTGFKANIQAGETVGGLDPSQTVEADWGADILGGRGHVILAGTWSQSPEPVPLADLRWFQKRQGAAYWVANPAFTPGNGQTNFIEAQNVGLAEGTVGGLIVASPKGTGAAANALRGIQFLGSDASPKAVNFGNLTAGALSNGGSLGYQDGEDNLENLGPPSTRYIGFAFGRYKLTDTIQASLQLNYGFNNVWSRTDPLLENALTINSGNPYIPASVQATMTADGITSFTLGEILSNNFDNYHITPGNYKSMTENSLNVTILDHRQLMRAVFSLDGAIGDNWSWNAYSEHSTVQVANHTLNNPLKTLVPLAVDAVAVTNANVGTSGLPIGSVACRSTLTAPTNGCVPMDVFGNGNITQDTMNYVSMNSIDFEDMVLNQDVLEASAQGVLPYGLPAGNVAVSFGANWRQEEAVQRATPYGPLGLFPGSDYGPFPRSSYHVFEGFAEINAPLLKNNIVQSANLDLAGRITDYSTSGAVETWKVGLTSQITDDIKLRASESIDIRAPQLNELFNIGASSGIPLQDPKTGLTQQVAGTTLGNPNLVPEVARTFAAGVVLTPTFVPGLSFSADYYSIRVTDEIGTIPDLTVTNQCSPTLASSIHPGQLGNPNDPLCQELIFDGPGGALSEILRLPLNIAYQITNGVDLAADYSMDFMGGTLHWSTNANLDSVNAIFNPSSGFNDSIGSNGTPKWRGQLSANYVTGPYSFTVGTRWFGTSVNTNTADTGNLATAQTANWYPRNEFEVPFVAYLDLRGSYQWNQNVQLYGAMDNVLNAAPPSIPLTSATVQSQGALAGTNITTYDMLGQVVRLGLRFSY
jgi:outer membrane cobalamin receptor